MDQIKTPIVKPLSPPLAGNALKGNPPLPSRPASRIVHFIPGSHDTRMKAFHDPSLLAEIDLLFAPDGVPNLAGDVGWNCYAKAFIATWLLRLWGNPASLFEGKLSVIDTTGKERVIINVNPHAWSGFSERQILDMSIRNVSSMRYMTVRGVRVEEDPAWGVYVEKKPIQYELITKGHISSAPRKFLVYVPERFLVFTAQSIKDVRATFSPSVTRTLSRYPENLLPKAVLHIFYFAEERAASLAEDRGVSPWDHLAHWDIDAYQELNRLLG